MRWSPLLPESRSGPAFAWPARLLRFIINGLTSPDSTDPNAPDGVANPPSDADAPKASKPPASQASLSRPRARSREIGGPSGLEPTRYGDWERNGRVSDF